MGTKNVHTTEESGEALARVAIGEDEGVKGVKGKYWEGRRVIESSKVSYDEGLQEDLYKGTLGDVAKMIGGDEKVVMEKLRRFQG